MGSMMTGNGRGLCVAMVALLANSALLGACSGNADEPSWLSEPDLATRSEIEAAYEAFFQGRHPEVRHLWSPESAADLRGLRRSVVEAAIEYAAANPVPRNTIYQGEEYSTWVIDCMQALGVEAEVSSVDITFFSSPDDPSMRSVLVFDVCVQYQVFAGTSSVSTALDEAAFERRYERYVSTYECLKENGFPTENPPSLEAFLEEPRYYPYVALGALGPTSFNIDLGVSSEGEMEALAARYPAEAELIRALWTCPIPPPE